jgi:transcriptional regulator with XRE-family HTH domain
MILSPKSFASDLKLWRKAQGLKQDALAYLLGVTQPAISRWEAGVDMPSQALQLRLRDMMCPSARARQKIEDFVLRKTSALEASFDLDGVKLLATSQGMQRAWPMFSVLPEMRLFDHLIGEAAMVLHDEEMMRDIKRGEIAVVSAVSDGHVSLPLDTSFRHRWHATFRSYGPRMVAHMVYEPCAENAQTGIETLVRLDDMLV